ncbi:hypothetical protein Goshw_005278 [Gossypium schwendimanii]|uniref:Uncharacterized protein n=1 Tax=Gossypium schwendimanii TaxID=34291 RepID=A0A7J9N761_GOSSC|nr:hypothetical protein [Gossypium schwendimanii]
MMMSRCYEFGGHWVCTFVGPKAIQFETVCAGNAGFSSM